MRRYLPFLLGFVFSGAGAWPALAADCDDRFGRHDAVFCEERTYDLAAGGRLEVDARPNGGIRVEGGSAGGIKVVAKIAAHAATDAAARAIAARVKIETDPVVRATGPGTSRGEGWVVSFRVTVPAQSRLRLQAGNGPLSLHGVEGDVELDTVNGPLSIKDSSGNIHGRTVNGPLHVDLTGDRWAGEGLDVQTTNGPVNVQVPAGYSAELEVGTVNGPASSDVDEVSAQMKGRRGRHGPPKPVHVAVTLGGGGAKVRAVTTNGPLSVDRR